ncbi:hypothetical protein [Flavobacterium sp. XGLA_31]|uniref:hypothetical protein n=1 Tax=Flavobacterium sp. XGLA_31 TaxID=3447666 RepID=UPI003F2A292B
MKNLMHLAVLLTIMAVTHHSQAQEIKFKDTTILADGTATYSFEKKGMGSQLLVYKLNTQETIVSLEQLHQGFDRGPAGNYVSFVFPGQNVTITSKTLQHNNWKFLVSLLMSEKVIDAKGNVDALNLKRFQQKFDEKIAAK